MTPNNFKQALINNSSLSKEEFLLGEVICHIMENNSNPKMKEDSEIHNFLHLILNEYSYQITETSSNLFDYRKSKRMLVEAVLGFNKAREIKHPVKIQRFYDKDKNYLKQLKKEVGIRRFKKIKDVIFESKEFKDLESFFEKKISLKKDGLLKRILKNHPTFKSFLFQYQEKTSHG